MTLKIVNRDEDAKESVRKVLEAALEEHFDSVVVLGFKSDKWRVDASRQIDIVKKLGAIEAMKLELWNSTNA